LGFIVKEGGLTSRAIGRETEGTRRRTQRCLHMLRQGKDGSLERVQTPHFLNKGSKICRGAFAEEETIVPRGSRAESGGASPALERGGGKVSELGNIEGGGISYPEGLNFRKKDEYARSKCGRAAGGRTPLTL